MNFIRKQGRSNGLLCPVLPSMYVSRKRAGRLDGKILDKYLAAIWDSVVLRYEVCSITKRLAIWSKNLGHGSDAVT